MTCGKWIRSLIQTVENITKNLAVEPGYDPIGQGFVASLARPGENITGFTFVGFPLIGKWLETLKEIAPGVRRVALMFNPQTAP